MKRTPSVSTGYTRRQYLKAVGSVGLYAAGLTVLSGCGAVALPGQVPPPPKVPRIGYLSLGTAPNSTAVNYGFTDAFRQGLRELGYTEGQTIDIDWRLADGRADILPELASELAQRPVDVLVAGDIQAIQAASQVTNTIPIVMTLNGDPVRTGLVASLARPGGNLTGLTSMSVGASAKRVELLKEAVPSLVRGVVFWNPTVPDRVLDFQETEHAARTLGIEIMSVGVRAPDDFEAAFETAAAWHPDSVFLLADSLIISYGDQIEGFAVGHGLPSICEGRGWPDYDDGLMSYGPSQTELYRRAATYVDKILKGARASDLPVEQPTKFDFVINLRTARTLGLTIPQSILLQATDLINE